MEPAMIATLCETVMIVCFGLSWPLSVYKSWKSRTAKGKSLQFEIFIWIGYIFGIAKNFIKFANFARLNPGFRCGKVASICGKHNPIFRQSASNANQIVIPNKQSAGSGAVQKFALPTSRRN